LGLDYFDDPITRNSSDKKRTLREARLVKKRKNMFLFYYGIIAISIMGLLTILILLMMDIISFVMGFLNSITFVLIMIGGIFYLRSLSNYQEIIINSTNIILKKGGTVERIKWIQITRIELKKMGPYIIIYFFKEKIPYFRISTASFESNCVRQAYYEIIKKQASRRRIEIIESALWI